MEIRTLDERDEVAFRAFQDLLLAEKASGNAFIETKKVTDFSAFVQKSRALETHIGNPDWSTVTTYYAFDQGDILGKISCRWELDKGDLASVGGHIGYVTSPKYRQKGLMTALVTFALSKYRERGVTSILVTANKQNIASRKTIEKVGGRLEKSLQLPDDYPSPHMAGQTITRYWIDLDESLLELNPDSHV